MAAYLRDPQGGDKLVECAGTALIDGCLEPGKGFFTESGAGDDVRLVPLQLINVAEILHPTVGNKDLQRSFRQALDLHAGLATEMDEFSYQLGGASSVLAVQLAGTAGAGPGNEWSAAAGAGHGQHKSVALGQVVRNLRDDHIGLIDLDLIPNPSSNRLLCSVPANLSTGS